MKRLIVLSEDDYEIICDQCNWMEDMLYQLDQEHKNYLVNEIRRRLEKIQSILDKNE